MGAALIGVVNGGAREAVLKDVGTRSAHQISTGTLVAGLAGYMCVLEQRWPIPDQRTALKIGSTWAVATIAFEVGFGRLVGPDPKSWSELLDAYDIRKGHLWPFVLLVELLGPTAIRSMRQRRSGNVAA